MADALFDTLNPYDQMQAVSGRDPDDLIQTLRGIRTPFKIEFIVVDPRNGRHWAYIRGHLPKRRGRPPTKGND